MRHLLTPAEALDGQRRPRAPLAQGPTPLEPVTALSAELGTLPLYVKREDCTELAMGGNKVRQLEYQLGDALERGVTVLLVSGAVQSNFVRVAAAAAAKFGLACEIFLEDRVSGVGPDYYQTGNVLLDRLFGARIHHFPNGKDESVAERLLRDRARQLQAQGAVPHVISTSIEAPPLGALGYVDVAQELLDQTRNAGVRPTDIVVASGTGYTQVGLLVGLRARGYDDIAVHGISVRRPADQQRWRVLALAHRTENLVGVGRVVRQRDVLVSDELLGPAYGRLSEAVREAVLTAARTEGLLLDPVYSGRALAGLLQLARTGALGGGGTIFIHTGGAPALFAYPELIRGEAGRCPRVRPGRADPARESSHRCSTLGSLPRSLRDGGR